MTKGLYFIKNDDPIYPISCSFYNQSKSRKNHDSKSIPNKRRPIVTHDTWREAVNIHYTPEMLRYRKCTVKPLT